MFREEKDYYIIEEFEKNGITAVYSKKSMGNMSDYCKSADNSQENRKKFLDILNLEKKTEVTSHQTHTNNVKVIDKHVTKYSYHGIDGFITDRRDVALFTFYADCLPLFVYDMKNKVIGVAHSGWPGTYKEMQKSLVSLMNKKFGTKYEDLLLGLGIGIQRDDYEVDTDFYQKFLMKFDEEIVKKSFTYSIEKEKYFFDNIMFNKITALRLGILEKNIIISSESTMDKKFHSYRREKEKSGRATAMIAFR